jgi:hypothetical protein
MALGTPPLCCFAAAVLPGAGQGGPQLGRYAVGLDSVARLHLKSKDAYARTLWAVTKNLMIGFAGGLQTESMKTRVAGATIWNCIWIIIFSVPGTYLCVMLTDRGKETVVAHVVHHSPQCSSYSDSDSISQH